MDEFRIMLKNLKRLFPVASVAVRSLCFDDLKLSEIIMPEGKNRLGETYMEFYADDAALQQLVIDTFYRPVEE